MTDTPATIDDGGSAFPTLETEKFHPQFGMSLRDYFAAQAMVGLLRTGDALHLLNGEPEYPFHVNFADSCYLLADAMLAARTPPTGVTNG